jgi:hypothetical protein
MSWMSIGWPSSAMRTSSGLADRETPTHVIAATAAIPLSISRRASGQDPGQETFLISHR